MRSFRGKSVRNESETGIGIEEVRNGETLQIYSLYYDRQLSRRDIATEVLKIVYMNVIDDECHTRYKAKLSSCGDNYKLHWSLPYMGLIKIDRNRFKPIHEDAYLLAQDALERRYTIKEVLE